MAPNAAIASRFGAIAQAQTFLMSNIVPQAPALNQGPWKNLEHVIANQAAQTCGKLWVIVGPIYDDEDEFGKLPNGTEIPAGFFCVIADELTRGEIRMQAFILPQQVTRKTDFRIYRTSVDYVESESGWNFFSELPDDLENKAEQVVLPYWLE